MTGSSYMRQTDEKIAGIDAMIDFAELKAQLEDTGKYDFRKLKDYTDAKAHFNSRVAGIESRVRGSELSLNSAVSSSADEYLTKIKSLWSLRRKPYQRAYEELKELFDDITIKCNDLIKKHAGFLDDYVQERRLRNKAYEELSGGALPPLSKEEIDAGFQDADTDIRYKPLLATNFNDDGDELWHKIEKAVDIRMHGEQPQAEDPAEVTATAETTTPIDDDSKFYDEAVLFESENELGGIIRKKTSGAKTPKASENVVVDIHEKTQPLSWIALGVGIVFAFIDYYFFRQTMSQLMNVSTRDILLSWIVPAGLALIAIAIMFLFAGPFATYKQDKRMKLWSIGSIIVWLAYGSIFIISRLLVPMEDNQIASVILAALFFVVYIVDGLAMYLAGKDIASLPLRSYRKHNKNCKRILRKIIAVETEISKRKSAQAMVRGGFGALKMHSVETLTSFRSPNGFVDTERKAILGELVDKGLVETEDNIPEINSIDFLAK